jgi:glycosyltransferase 2 family protein
LADARRNTWWLPAFRLVGVAIALVILWVAFRRVDIRRVRDLVVGLGWLVLVIPVPQLSSFCCETLGWKWAFRSLGRRVSYLPLLRVRMTTDALTHSLPGGVVWCETTAPFLLRRHCGVPLPEGVAGVAARKYLLLLSQSVYVGLIFLFGFSYLQASSARVLGVHGLPWVVLGISAVLGLAAAAVSVGLQRGALASRVHTWLERIPSRRWRSFLAQKRPGFVAADDQMARFFGSSLTRRAPAALSFLAGWVSESIETFLILRLLGVDLDFTAVASFEVVLAFLRHTLVFLPAGLGVQDAGYAAFLGALGVPGALSVAAAFVLLKRSKEVLWASAGYAFLLVDRKHGLEAEQQLVEASAE